jgi:hypothetical protein
MAVRTVRVMYIHCSAHPDGEKKKCVLLVITDQMSLHRAFVVTALAIEKLGIDGPAGAAFGAAAATVGAATVGASSRTAEKGSRVVLGTMPGSSSCRLACCARPRSRSRG